MCVSKEGRKKSASNQMKGRRDRRRGRGKGEWKRKYDGK